MASLLSSLLLVVPAVVVPIKILFEPLDNDEVEGYIKVKGKIYQFNSREELNKILRK